MKKTLKIILLTVIFILNLILLINSAACSSPKANQDINPVDAVRAVMEKLEISPDDVGALFYSEGDEDHIYDDILLKIMFPPDRSTGGDIAYTMDLFEQYAIIQFTKAKPVMFEIAVFKVSQGETENNMLYRNKLGKIETMCKERAARLKKTALEYSPELAFAAERANVYIFDNYIYYIIAEDYMAAYSAIKSELTAKN